MPIQPERMKHLLELSFEPLEDVWVYYRRAGAPGRPVSSKERDDYLSSWTLVSQARFDRMVRDRKMLSSTSMRPSRHFTSP